MAENDGTPALTPPPFDMLQVEAAWQRCLRAARERFDRGEYEDTGSSDADHCQMEEVEGVPCDVNLILFANMRPGRAGRDVIEATWRVVIWPIGEEERDEPWAQVDLDFEYVAAGVRGEPQPSELWTSVWALAADELLECGPYAARRDESLLAAAIALPERGRAPRI